MSPTSIAHAVLAATTVTAACSGLVLYWAAVVTRASLGSLRWFLLLAFGLATTVVAYVLAVHAFVNWGSADGLGVWADPSSVKKAFVLLVATLGTILGGRAASRRLAQSAAQQGTRPA
jgi:hypothetical protein